MENKKTNQTQETWQERMNRLLTVPPGTEARIFESWAHVQDPLTGKSIFLPFSGSEFTFQFNAPKPDESYRDCFLFKAPAIFQFKNIKRDFPFLSCHDNMGSGNQRLAVELLRWFIKETTTQASSVGSDAAPGGQTITLDIALCK